MHGGTRAAIASRRTRRPCYTASSPGSVTCAAPSRITAAIEPQVKLERDDRCERRHVRRRPENLRAIYRVPPHDPELFGRAPALFRISSGVLTSAMSCIRAASPNSRSSAPSTPSARLRRGEDRHVHHVREGVVVVLPRRRQRHQRVAVL